MHIESVYIKAFGRFQEFILQIGQSEQGIIIYGENEAGKTTLAEFIKSILFGFAGKKEAEKYISIHQPGQVGGTLSIRLATGEILTVERYFNWKQARFHYHNGNRTSEDLSGQLTGELNRSLFEDVYYIDLDRLKGIEEMNADGFSEFLFQTGLTGGRRIAKAEKMLSEGHRELFKPGGTRPQINDTLNQLKTLKNELKKHEKLHASYIEIEKELNECRETLAELELDRISCRDALQKQEQYEKLKPLLSEYEKASTLAKKRRPSFIMAEDAKNNHERLSEKKLQISAEKKELEARIHHVEKDLAPYDGAGFFLESESAILKAEQQQAYRESLNQELTRINENINIKQSRISSLLDQLGPEWTAEDIKGCMTTTEASHQLKKLNTERAHLFQQMEAAEEERHHAFKKKTGLEKKIVGLQKSSGPDSSRRQGAKSPIYLLFGAGALSLGLGLFNFISGQMTAAIGFFILFIACILSAGLIKKQFPSDGGWHEQTVIRENEISRLNIEAEALSEEMKEKITLLDQLEQKLELNEKNLENWTSSFEFKAHEDPGVMIEWFDLIRHGKDHLDALEALESEREQLQMLIKGIEEEKQSLFNRLDFHGQVRELMTELKNDKAAIQQKQRLVHKKEILLEQWEAADQALKITERELSALFKQASAEDESAFLANLAQYEEWQDAKQRTEDCERQLRAAVDEDQKKVYLEWMGTENIRRNKFDIDRERKGIEEKINQTRNRETGLLAEMKKLETDTTLSELQHAYASKQDELDHLVYKWRVYKAAEHILASAKSVFLKEKMPQILETMGRYLSRLTGGKYIRVYLQEEIFSVESHNGGITEAGALSRGTKEQLYLALKLAMAVSYKSRSIYPIIIDDGFVNFDEERFRACRRLLKEISSCRQIIYFTCRKQEMEHWDHFLDINLGGVTKNERHDLSHQSGGR